MNANSPTLLFFDVAPKLDENGYRVVPIHYGRKNPSCGRRWQKYVYKKGDAQRYSTDGCGILCGDLAPIDIDVRVAPLVGQLEQLVLDMLGGSAPRRVGLPPKVMLLARAEAPFRHLTTRGFHLPGDGPEDKPHRLEILGIDQQAVVYNIHEVTGKPYMWNGAEPLTVPLSALPILTEARAREIIEAADKILAAYSGARPESQFMKLDAGRPYKPNEELLAKDPALLRKALAAIPNADLDYHDWIRVLYATKGALGDDGRDAFLAWSAQSAKDKPRYSAEQYGYANPRKLGAGTVYFLAAQHGWKRPPPAKRAASADPSTAAPATEPAADAKAAGSEGRPVIEVRAGELPRVVDEAQAALLAANVGIFQRSGQLVRIATLDKATEQDGVRRASGSIVITPVVPDYLTDRLAVCARFQRFDRRENKIRTIDPPAAVSKAILARLGNWPFPFLAGFITAPTLRADGSLLDRAGYDEASKLFGAFEPADFPAIPPRPARADAEAALALLKDLFNECAFDGGADSAHAAVALAAMITAVVRRALPTAPAFGISAPQASCGKTAIIKAIAQVCAGYDMPAKSPPDKRDESEFRKFLLGLLMAGDPCVLLDNIEEPVKSAAFCAAITSQTYSDRILGVNTTAVVRTETTWLLTGNGLIFVGDLTTRVLLCVLEQQIERPEERSFNRNLPAYIAEHRGKLLAAALTIPLAYFAAGEPRKTEDPDSRFKEWDRFVRRPLLWLGVADPLTTQAGLREDDPERSALVGLMHAWRVAFGGDDSTVANAIAIAGQQKQGSRPDLYDALHAAAGDKDGGINSRRLGRYMKRYAGRIADGMRIKVTGKDPVTHRLRYGVSVVLGVSGSQRGVNGRGGIDKHGESAGRNDGNDSNADGAGADAQGVRGGPTPLGIP